MYNKIGRVRTIIRKYLFKIFGINILKILDPTLRNLKRNSEERDAWIRDQYMHPIESLHTIDEVLKWFDDNKIEFINSIPASDFLDLEGNNLFIKSSKGNIFTRLVNQFSMIFNNLGSDGGLFVLIGKKNE